MESDGIEWNRMELDGIESDEMGYDGLAWNVIEQNEIGRSGEWDRTELNLMKWDMMD